MDVCGTLKEYNVRFTLKGDGKVEVLCPFHNDTNPSGSFNASSGFYICWACNTKSNLYGFLAKKLGKTKQEIYFAINGKYADRDITPLQPQEIEKWHQFLWQHETFLSELKHRMVDDETIREYRIGVNPSATGNNDRITIPIQDSAGRYIFARTYVPGATKHKFDNLSVKRRAFKSTKSDNKAVLYPIDQLSYDRILLVGGEIKALAAAAILNKHDIGVITSTEGENSWNNRLNPCFEGKTVYVCLDVDETGENGAVLRCRSLNGSVAWIGLINLPLDKEKYPKGDINDFLREGGDLLKLIDECEQWEFQAVERIDDSEPPKSVTLEQAVGASSAGMRIEFQAVISSIDTRPYSIPKRIKVVCQRGQECCSLCNIANNCPENKQEWEIESERIEVIEMVGDELRHQARVIKKAVGIPAKCLECTFEPLEYYNIEDARISQQLDITNRNTERTMQIAYCIGSKSLELNETYVMQGRMYPHPKNQQASLLVSNYEQTADALSTYEPTSLEHLSIFQPEEWTVKSIEAKLEHIYNDLSSNITFIYKRNPLHLTVDLAYHSPLLIQLNNRPENGWVEVLIVGDSAQGKSKTVERLMDHYGLGERVICKEATTAGLLGGVSQQGNKRWFVTWGKIPTNDRRLVALEELKGAKEGVIASLTDMRSSGRAVITKIETRSAWARTRLIAISNPRSMQPISAYNFGVDVIKELIGNPEDIRRFDMCLLLERTEVDAHEVSELEKNPPKVEHIYTSELCRELILWAWTVKNVVYENQSTIFDVASQLCDEYTDVIPIIDRFSMKLKLAKLSSALAVRTFSIKDDAVYVRDCHIHFIAAFLRKTYDSENFGYKRYSEIIMQSEKLVNERAIIQRIRDKTKFPEEFVDHSLITEEIDVGWIQDLMGWDQESARNLLGFLRRQRALKPADRRGYYKKTYAYTQLLKRINEEGLVKAALKPDYIEEREEF